MTGTRDKPQAGKRQAGKRKGATPQIEEVTWAMVEAAAARAAYVPEAKRDAEPGAAAGKKTRAKTGQAAAKTAQPAKTGFASPDKISPANKTRARAVAKAAQGAPKISDMKASPMIAEQPAPAKTGRPARIRTTSKEPRGVFAPRAGQDAHPPEPGRKARVRPRRPAQAEAAPAGAIVLQDFGVDPVAASPARTEPELRFTPLNVFGSPFEIIAAETVGYSHKALESGSAFVERLLGARSFESAVEIPFEYARKSYADFVGYVANVRDVYALWLTRLGAGSGAFCGRDLG